MRKLLIILIIITFALGIKLWFYFQSKPEVLEEPLLEKQLENLSLVIFKNTNFKDFNINNFSFRYPDWQKIEIDPMLIWPKEIAEKQEILLYLTNADGVTILMTKREVEPKDLTKPSPLIFRETLAKEREILEKEGGLTHYQVVREIFFDNEIILESKLIMFGKAIISISKSVIFKNKDFIYSVGISAPDRIFEDYRLVANNIIDSIFYY